jgi:hypothetical protein
MHMTMRERGMAVDWIDIADKVGGQPPVVNWLSP